MRSPILFEVNTRCWLRELSERAGRPITLSDVPDSELERWRVLGFTHIWLMGVWQIGNGPREVALRHWRETWSKEIPSNEADVHGSPFAIREYAIDSRLGEPITLLLLKERFAQFGLRLILDFVPNHLGLDSSEPLRYPARFVQSSTPAPGTFGCKTKFGKRHFVHGRDPYFHPWTDTIQFDYRVAETQQMMAAVGQTISMFGNGLRCDMAMLLLPDIFEETWKHFPAIGAHRTISNFWRAAIPAIRQLHPHVDLIAEAYWDREQELQDLGFDFTYNKKVYDFITRGQFAELSAFLIHCSPQYLRRSVHFLENHDEPRAAATLPLALHKAAALLILSLPGMTLLHDGQLEGRKAFAHIQLSKRAPEPADSELAFFYEDLLRTLQTTAIRRGKSEVLTSVGGVIAIAWSVNSAETDVTVINLQNTPQPLFWNHSREPERIYATGDGIIFGGRIQANRLVLEMPPQSGAILRSVDSVKLGPSL
jgi:hypothetical protein